MKLIDQYSVITHTGRLSNCYEELDREWGRVDERPDLYAGVVFIDHRGFVWPVDRDGKKEGR